MVIGNGMIANKFSEYQANENIVIFASGVSNSKESDDLKFTKEVNLLVRTHNQIKEDATLVYFSTYSIYDSSLTSSKYVKHKLYIENYIRNNFNKYLIFRVSNVVGRTNNPYTITNYIYNNIINNTDFELWNNAYRNLIDLDDVYKNAKYLIESKIATNLIINLINAKNYNINFIVSTFEEIIGKNANYIKIEKGTNFEIYLNDIEQQLYINTKTIFDDKYLEMILKKYYG